MTLDEFRVHVAAVLEDELRPLLSGPYRFTFIARRTDSPEGDIVVTEDEGQELAQLIERRKVT